MRDGRDGREGGRRVVVVVVDWDGEESVIQEFANQRTRFEDVEF